MSEVMNRLIVAVDDSVQQSREMDLMAGKHGRFIYVLDDASTLSELMQEVLGADVLVNAAGATRARG